MYSKSDAERLVLGTAQLALPYGIANTSGQPDENTAFSIIRKALEVGINSFDTAQDYGNSEKLLGKSFLRLGCTEKVNVVSKLSPEINTSFQEDIETAVLSSLDRLKVPALEGLLLHREDLLDVWHDGLGKNLQALRKRGWVRHLGISVYAPGRALEALQTDGVDIIQVPTNIFDRRFEKIGFFEQAAAFGKSVYVRSAFLQGLVFLDPTDVPQKVEFASEVLHDFQGLMERHHYRRNELALGYIRRACPEAKVIFGAETAKQIIDNLNAWRAELTDECIKDIQRTFDKVDEKILNPVHWS